MIQFEPVPPGPDRKIEDLSGYSIRATDLNLQSPMPPRDDPFGANQKSLPISHPKCDNFHLDTNFMNYNMKPTEETMIKAKTPDNVIPGIVTPEVTPRVTPEMDRKSDVIPDVDDISIRSTCFPSRDGTVGTSRLTTISELLYEYRDVKRLVLPSAKSIQL